VLNKWHPSKDLDIAVKIRIAICLVVLLASWGNKNPVLFVTLLSDMYPLSEKIPKKTKERGRIKEETKMSTITNFSIKNPQPGRFLRCRSVVLPRWPFRFTKRYSFLFIYMLDHGILLNICRFENS
jgi:hypothetical protein